MDKTDGAYHLWRVSQLVDRLEGQLSLAGRLEDETRQRLIQIRDRLQIYPAARPAKTRPRPKK